MFNKLLQPQAIFFLKVHKKAFSETCMRSLQHSPDILAGFKGAALWQEAYSRQAMSGKGGLGTDKKGKGEGIIPLPLIPGSTTVS